jgi:hypothetical protein
MVNTNVRHWANGALKLKHGQQKCSALGKQRTETETWSTKMFGTGKTAH